MTDNKEHSTCNQYEKIDPENFTWQLQQNTAISQTRFEWNVANKGMSMLRTGDHEFELLILNKFCSAGLLKFLSHQCRLNPFTVKLSKRLVRQTLQ